MHVREWFNLIFLSLLLGSYALLALFAFARALAGLVHPDRRARAEQEDLMNDTASVITLNHEVVSSYVSRRRESVAGQ